MIRRLSYICNQNNKNEKNKRQKEYVLHSEQAPLLFELL